MKYGYVRVSTDKQDLEMQLAAMADAGVSDENVYRDVISGKTTARDGLDVLLPRLKKGDQLYVWKLDRLGRRLSHLSALVDEFIDKGIHLISVTERFDVASPTGKAMIGMAAVFAEMERNNTSERTRAKLQHLKSQGVRLGPPKKHAEKYAEIVLMAKSGKTVRDIASLTGVSKSQVARIITQSSSV